MTRRSGAFGMVMSAAAIAVGTFAFASVPEQGRLESHVEQLTRPEMKGRLVGSPGHALARDYIVAQFEEVGLEPAGTDGWFTPATIVWKVETARSTELRVGETLLARGVDYRPLGFSDDIEVEASAVFVGYGLSEPKLGWDDYAGIDAAGKVVVALTDRPTRVDLEESQFTDDVKAATALAKGAAGLVLVNDPRTHGDLPNQRPDELGRMRPSTALTGLSGGRMTRRAGERLLREFGFELSELQQELDDGEPASFPLDVGVEMTMAVDRDEAVAENIVGKLPGEGPPVILGAHYDHLGEGIAGSLWDGEPRVHPGADDNASGVAVIIEAARRLERVDHRRPIIVTATTGEEIGLRGTRRLSRTIPATGALYLNLDMVGRLRDPGLRVLGSGRDARLQRAVDRAARSVAIPIVSGNLYDSTSDHIAFAEAGFDALHVTTGRHPDYHQPTDTIDQLNVEGMSAVTSFVSELVGALAK